MAKLYFRYGAMGSSKTANAIMTAFNYEEQGKRAIVVKPECDTRSGYELVSRLGISWPAVSVEDLKRLVKNDNIPAYDVVIVDEVQFLSEQDVNILANIVDAYQIPVICYGLKTDFTGKLFEGSKRMVELADEIEEIPTICWCGKKARFNARIDNLGNVLRDGPVLMVGWNDQYAPLCRKHFMLGMANRVCEEQQ